MTFQSRLDQWKQQAQISSEQHARILSQAREEPFSLFLEINVLLYLGILAFVAGLGWTVATWSGQLGDVLILTLLTAILAVTLWYTFSRAPAWSPRELSRTSPLLDYVLYLGCLVWCIELAYIEKQFHLLSGQWDIYLLLTACFFFFLAYRFDNRFVLSLALSSLAGWLGLTISHWPSIQDATYRDYALLYCLIVSAAAILSKRVGFRQHFFGTYLNVAANVLFCALLSGVFELQGFAPWFVALLLAAAASGAWGISQRQFVFVAYAAVYGYIGLSTLLIRNSTSFKFDLLYFVTTAIAMLVVLVAIARKFGRPE